MSTQAPASPPTDAAIGARLSLVIHDVAPATWPACERILRSIAEVARLPVTLLAVPRYHRGPRDAAFEQWLRGRAAHGDEVALHGYTHLDDGEPRGWIDHLRRRHYTRGEGEFADLPQAEAGRRLAAGLAWFDELRLAPRGFVAPAWLLSRGAWAAVRATPFDYTCTLRSIFLLREGRRVDSQSLVYSSSSAWRRAASRLWVPGLAALQSANPLQRLELHPVDADHASIRRSWQGVLERLLRHRSALTLADFAAASSPRLGG